jgi:hypothetical protein
MSPSLGKICTFTRLYIALNLNLQGQRAGSGQRRVLSVEELLCATLSKVERPLVQHDVHLEALTRQGQALESDLGHAWILGEVLGTIGSTKSIRLFSDSFSIPELKAFCVERCLCDR